MGMADADQDPSTPCAADSGVALTAEISVNLNISSVPAGSTARTQFEQWFASDMALQLGIDGSRIQVTGITGSRRRLTSGAYLRQLQTSATVVAFTILPANDGSSFSGSALQTMFNAGMGLLGGTQPLQLSNIATSAFADCIQIWQPCAGFEVPTPTHVA